jgi:flagellar hook-basal body complex protein FliE
MTIPVSGVVTPALSEWAVPKAGGGEWAVEKVAGDPAATQNAAATDPAGGFDSMLGNAIDSLQHTQENAATQARELATGQTQDVTSVVTAVQEASLSMQLASQVRNKAVEAYSEIFHTQV